MNKAADHLITSKKTFSFLSSDWVLATECIIRLVVAGRGRRSTAFICQTMHLHHRGRQFPNLHVQICEGAFSRFCVINRMTLSEADVLCVCVCVKMIWLRKYMHCVSSIPGDGGSLSHHHDDIIQLRAGVTSWTKFTPKKLISVSGNYEMTFLKKSQFEKTDEICLKMWVCFNVVNCLNSCVSPPRQHYETTHAQIQQRKPYKHKNASAALTCFHFGFTCTHKRVNLTSRPISKQFPLKFYSFFFHE